MSAPAAHRPPNLPDPLGVHRSSVYSWFESDPNLKQTVEEIRRARSERFSYPMREREAPARSRLFEGDSVPSAVQFRTELAIFNRPKEPSGRKNWHVRCMESPDASLGRKPLVHRALGFSTRQTSTLFAVSDAGSRLEDRPGAPVAPAEVRTRVASGAGASARQALYQRTAEVGRVRES